MSTEQETVSKRKRSTPPEGYTCKLCHQPGHWIQQCSLQNNNKKKKRIKTSNHIPIPGVDPSPENIQEAKDYQKIPPPNCFCGKRSRLKKVKRSHASEQSKAIGHYFFFCALKKQDNPCRFARPVQDELRNKKERLCTFFVKTGSCRKGDKCKFLHDEDAVRVPGWKRKQDDSSTNPTPKETLDDGSSSPVEKEQEEEDTSSKIGSSSSSSDSSNGKSSNDKGVVKESTKAKSSEEEKDDDDDNDDKSTRSGNSSSSSSSSNSEEERVNK